jgi:anti-sigma B factor antagonist
MKIQQQGETLCITGIKELGLANCDSFGEEVRRALPEGIKDIVIDLSETGYMDCSGLGALVALGKTARLQNGEVSVRLLNPAPAVRQIVNLTKLSWLFPGLTVAESAATHSARLLAGYLARSI